jgi:ABC-2 type transport system ATP-binding protein
MIQVEELTRTYGSLTAIDRLSFSVAKGEIVGFLGPNGAGKSTTMRILTGSLAATAGRARVGGIDVFDDPRAVKRIVGYLPEFPPLYTDMTVRDYLRFAARIKGAKDVKAAVEKSIQRVGLEKVAHRLIDHLSKGYRQRVGIAQALVHDPQVLILDEPSSGLDPAQRVEIRELVKELSEGDVTVVLSTHVLPEIEAICDRVIIIHQGRIVAQDRIDALAQAAQGVALRVQRVDDGLLAALRAVPEVREVTDEGDGRLMVETSTDVRPAVAAAAVPYGLLELGARRKLEDVFLQLTRDEGGSSAAGGEA